MADASSVQVEAQAAISKEVAKRLLTLQNTSLDKLAELRAKIIENTATQADKDAYSKEKANFDSLEQQLNAASTLGSAEAKAIKEEQRKKKLSRLKGSQGSISQAKPGDLFEYVLRTQALNPYSRERSCDIEFMDLLSVIAKETNQDVARINELKALIKDSVSGN